ncbi:MAG TPA: DUF4065 domain-containing protein [Alphaproteobacteria bacterium]|nr:DUF4065 domain-containing protein [Alphaproteobacteria bacterium]
MTALNIFDVAKSLIESHDGNISAIKLQKLCYYCQAWNLVWHNEPLFNNTFQAWRYGPVCRELYDLHKGKFVVGVSDIPENKLSRPLSENEIETINKVFAYYGYKDANWLVELSHNEKPWKFIREKCKVSPGGNCEETIPDDIIRDYYANI